MKLSALNTDRALDVLCELTPYVSSIVSDETIIKPIGTVLVPCAGPHGGKELPASRKIKRRRSA